jgi:hypothetical protein
MSNVDDAEPQLTETQKAYNVAAGSLFQLAAYGHCVYHPAGEMATERGKRQHERYRDLIRAAQARFEAAALRKAADAAEAETTQLKAHGVLEPGAYRPCRDVVADLRAEADRLEEEATQ